MVKTDYLIQPYFVGSKEAKSLALIIPARIRKETNIDASTIFMLSIDEKTKRITLQRVNEIIEKNENSVSADKNLVASKQQTLLKIQ